MERSSVATGVIAALLGAILGFLALFLREIGIALAAVVLAGLAVYYVRNERHRDVGWLLLAAGLAPVAILGRNAATTVIDPAVEVGPDTWWLLALFGGVAAAGAIIEIASFMSDTNA